MRRIYWLRLLAGALGTCVLGCAESDPSDPLVDASDPATPYDASFGDAADAGGERDAAQAAPDAASPDAGHVDPWPDPEHDAGPGYDCFEEFVWDPHGRTDVVSVVVASAYLSAWDPTRSPALALADDGTWRVSLPMLTTIMPYKFVVNGSEWLADESACHGEADGFGGQNSLRYACQQQPACPGSDDDAGAADASTPEPPDASAPDASAPDASTPDAGDGLDGGDGLDAGSADASSPELDASLEADAGAVIDPSCPCYHTAWIDLDDRPGVAQDDILEVVLVGDHALLGSWDPGFSSVVLTPAGEGVWFARVAPPAEASQYKLVVRHRNAGLHPNVWLHDEGSCEARQDDNNVLYACGAGSACTPEPAPVALPGTQVDLCTRCDVTLSIPFSAGAGLAEAASVVVQGEQAPLAWGGSYALDKGKSAFSATFSMPRGRYEYQVMVDDGGFAADPASCSSTPNGANSFLYACDAPPHCD